MFQCSQCFSYRLLNDGGQSRVVSPTSHTIHATDTTSQPHCVDNIPPPPTHVGVLTNSLLRLRQALP